LHTLRTALATLVATGIVAVTPARTDAAGSAPAARPARTQVVLGIIPELNLFKQRARFQLLAEYLSRRIGVPVHFTILSRYGNILERFEADQLDGAFFGSFTGALAIQRLGVVPLARPVNLDGTSTYHGYVFVRRDSGIHDAAAMKGKRIALVDKATTAGYVFPLAWLRERGVSSFDGWFSETWFTGSHDASIAAVLEKKADVGCAKHSVYDRVRAEDPRVDRDLAILGSSPPVPSNGLCVRADMEPDLREALRRALLDLPVEPEGAKVLQQLGALRFIETTAADYAPVGTLARQAGIDLRTYRYRNE
jgi:phosphonate transport system substrate-binding protein